MPSLAQVTGFTCACVEYRLAPADKHPAQALDVLSALKKLSSSAPLPEEGGQRRWNRQSIYLLGHSAGAFIAMSLVLRQPLSESSTEPTFAVRDDVRQAVKGIVCIDGIYDLPSLLEEYPSYDSFINDAFGLDADVLERESPARWELPEQTGVKRRLRILVLHSREDELLSMRQPENFVIKMRWLLRDAPERGQVEADYESVAGTHDDLLKTSELSVTVKTWVAKVEQEEA